MSTQIDDNTTIKILRRYYSAMNTGNVDEALSLFADDAVRLDTAEPDLIIVGKTQIEAGLRARVKDNILIEADDYKQEGSTACCLATVYTDYGRRLGFAPVIETAEIVVEADKIKRFAVTVLPESLERINSAEQRHQSAAGK